MRNLDEARAAYERGEGGLKELAARYTIPYSTITRRCLGDEWRKPRSRRGIAKMSVNAYAYIHGFWITRCQLDTIEARAHAQCHARNIEREIKDDDRFGAVFIYPVDILASLFAELNLRKPVIPRQSEERA